jgi:hypothetical protein
MFNNYSSLTRRVGPCFHFHDAWRALNSISRFPLERWTMTWVWSIRISAWLITIDAQQEYRRLKRFKKNKEEKKKTSDILCAFRADTYRGFRSARSTNVFSSFPPPARIVLDCVCWISMFERQLITYIGWTWRVLRIMLVRTRVPGAVNSWLSHSAWRKYSTGELLAWNETTELKRPYYKEDKQLYIFCVFFETEAQTSHKNINQGIFENILKNTEKIDYPYRRLWG